MIYDSKITETVKINTTETVTFTPKANITAKDTGIEVSAIGNDLYLNNNITVTNSATSGTVEVNGVYSDVYTLYLYNKTAKKTIKATGKITSGDLDVYGIHLENPYLYMTDEELLYNFNTSAVVDTDGDIKAVGFSASQLSSYVAFKGNYTVSAKIGQGMALSYGISLGEAFIRNVSGKFKVSAEAKAGVASAIGVSLNLQKLYSSNIASRLTGSFTVSAKGVMVSAVAVYAASDLSLISVSGAMNVTAKGIQVASAAAIVSNSDIYLYGINSSKITVNSSGVTGSVTYPSKVAAILSEKEDGKIVIGSYTGAISVTASIDDEESNVYGIFAQGNITFNGDYTGKLSVVSKDDACDVAGIYSDGFVTMQDITGAWSISANEGYAYGIYGEDGISLGNVSGNKTITSKDDYAYGFYTEGKFQAESISGKISVSAEEYAYGIYSYDDAALGDLSGMTLQVTSKESSAYGIHTYELDDIYSDLIIGSTGLDLGKINVTAYDVAEGVYIYGDITTATVTAPPILSGTVTVKGYDAYGIDADSFDCKIGANVTVNGKRDAIGIYVYNDDVIFEGAKITAKVSTKENCAYAVYHDGNTNYNTIALRGKSQLTGSIYAVAGDDTVVIESGSKLTGGLKDVENLVFDINDASTKKQVMWNATGDWGESALDYNIDFGLLGDFALAQKTKNMQWSDLISNLESLSKSNALYDYIVYEKGNTLYLKSEISPAYNAKVVENKSTATKEISAEYTLFTSKADINVKNGWGIGSEQETETHLVLDNNITVSGSAEMLAGIYSSSEYDLTIYSNNAAKKLKVSNNADETMVAGYIHTGNLSFGSSKFLQDITVSSNGSNGFAVGFYSFVGDAKTPFAGAVEFAGTYAGKLTVSSKDIAFGIWSVDVKMKDITGVWNISGETGAGVLALGDMSFGNISGNKTITAKGGDAYLLATGFGEVLSPTGNISLNSISGNIKVSAYGDACMILAHGNLSVKDLSKLNLQVTSKTDDACGIHLEQQNLVMQSTGLNVGKINVKTLHTAEGFFVRGKITADKITDQTILTGKINIQGEEAYGFRVSDGFDCKIGVDMTVNGKNEAYGIYTQRGDVILEGAKITAKVSDKSSFAYAVYEVGDDDSKGNSIALRKKSQLTGNIRAEGAKDTVKIESGSKLTGALSDVENLILELNDQAAAKKSLWDITADLSDNTSLEIDFELGMTGDFVLANNKSGAEWNGLFEDKISLDFDGETQYLFLSDVTTYGYDSLTYNDYDFTLKTKGSQLILSVTID